ncbi:hypothetical protein [Archangium lipolyticum]|uniref:hypothetical protein n=1 Tax=Archangium lipolyticum TaxID=2970465 RepID=UPI002149BF04|nr:hypothetical protein [Archangium lipolyticum]
MNEARRAGWWIVALFLFSACSHDVGARSRAELAAEDEAELYAAIVRGTVANFGGDRTGQTLHCLRVCVRGECGAPSDRFLSLFVKDRFMVSGPEACKWQGDKVVPARDSLLTVATGRYETRVAPSSAMFLDVEKVRYTSPDHASADASITHGNVGANGLTLTLERVDGRWKVVKTVSTWTS